MAGWFIAVSVFVGIGFGIAIGFRIGYLTAKDEFS